MDSETKALFNMVVIVCITMFGALVLLPLAYSVNWTDTGRIISKGSEPGLFGPVTAYQVRTNNHGTLDVRSTGWKCDDFPVANIVYVSQSRLANAAEFTDSQGRSIC